MVKQEFEVGDIVTYNVDYPHNNASSTIKSLKKAIVHSEHREHGSQVVVLTNFITNKDTVLKEKIHAWSYLVKFLEPKYEVW
jgi:hypothetical protein